MEELALPTDPAARALLTFELALMALGLVLAFRILALPGPRARWLATNRLAAWPLSVAEFVFYAALVFLLGFGGQAVVQAALGGALARAADRDGLQVVAYGAAFHGAGIFAWLVFPAARRKWFAGYGAEPPPLPPPPSYPLPAALRAGAATVAIALPVLAAVSLSWTFLLRHLGLPDGPQDLIGVFAAVRSPLVIAGMLAVACVLAPTNEELIFRAGLYRYCRQRLGRGWALLISGTCFGALHMNLAGFVPLALLGMGLALLYEATGSVRVAVIAHGFFNLNTVLVVLAGFPS
jgi:membrane protease YdiL (CAAX protease family)